MVEVDVSSGFPRILQRTQSTTQIHPGFYSRRPVISWEKGFLAEVVYAILCQIIKQLHSGGAARDWFQVILSDNDNQPNRSK